MIAFYSTRVKDPNVHDWAKLRYTIGYLWKTRFLPLIILIDDKGNVYVHIDGPHAIHADAKGHLDLFLIIGYGAMINASKKLGLVTMSSIETEIVACRERFPKYI